MKGRWRERSKKPNVREWKSNFNPDSLILSNTLQRHSMWSFRPSCFITSKVMTEREHYERCVVFLSLEGLSICLISKFPNNHVMDSSGSFIPANACKTIRKARFSHLCRRRSSQTRRRLEPDRSCLDWDVPGITEHAAEQREPTDISVPVTRLRLKRILAFAGCTNQKLRRSRDSNPVLSTLLRTS